VEQAVHELNYEYTNHGGEVLKFECRVGALKRFLQDRILTYRLVEEIASAQGKHLGFAMTGWEGIFSGRRIAFK
jgi:hypothetical protein